MGGAGGDAGSGTRDAGAGERGSGGVAWGGEPGGARPGEGARAPGRGATRGWGAATDPSAPSRPLSTTSPPRPRSTYFFLQFPSTAILMLPFEPVVKLFYAFPFAGLIAFLGLQIGVVNNQSLSRFIRYNSMQAILLDIILIVPSLLGNVFGKGGLGVQLQISMYNTVWLFTFACVVYAMASSLLGQYARLPLVADAADAQVPQ